MLRADSIAEYERKDEDPAIRVLPLRNTEVCQVMLFLGNLLKAASRQQQSSSLSSCEAELISLTQASHKVHLKSLGCFSFW